MSLSNSNVAGMERTRRMSNSYSGKQATYAGSAVGGTQASRSIDIR